MPGNDFIPLAIETYSCFHPRFDSILSSCVHATITCHQQTFSIPWMLISYFRQWVSIALQCAQTIVILQKATTFSHSFFILSVATPLWPSVRMKLTLPKLGTWSPPGLPKTQSLISGVKTPRIEVFFISLERSWILNVQNGLAWVIWTYATQVMGKRKAGS
jgi:hypothetical protein